MKYGQFFEIPKSSLLAGELLFLSRAVAEDMSRYFMEYIQVEESFRALATDGRRLHIVKRLNNAADKVYEMKPGKYLVKRAAGKYVWLVKIESDMGQFPDCDRVIPKGDPDWTGECYGFGATQMTKVVDLFYSFPKPTKLNINYLIDLGDHHYKVHWRKPPEEGNKFVPVVFESDTRLAVIMTMQFDGENP